jgi:hypothetical protein
MGTLILTLQPMSGEPSMVEPDTDVRFPNSGSSYPFVNNFGSGVVLTVTALAQRKCDQGFLDDHVHTVQPDQKTVILGPYTRWRFNDEPGRVRLTFSVIDGIGVAAVMIPYAGPYT